MIRVIKGSYGLAMPDGTVQAMRPGSDPFEESKSQEALLVKQGVAVYVDEPTKESDVHHGELPVFNVGMKLSELKEVAAAYGVNVVGKKKSEILSDLNAVAENPDGI